MSRDVAQHPISSSLVDVFLKAFNLLSGLFCLTAMLIGILLGSAHSLSKQTVW
jgi:hypothetical protein